MAQLRKYKLTIKQYLFDRITQKFNALNFETFVIEDITVDMTVVKDAISQGGRSRVVLRNLSSETIDRIVQDRYSSFLDNTTALANGDYDATKDIINGINLYPTCKIEMGYNDELVNVFNGIIDTVTARREGTDLVVDMELMDQGFYYIRKKLDTGPISLTKGQTTLRAALNSLYKITEQLSTEYTLDLTNSELTSADLDSVYDFTSNKNINTSGKTFNDLFFEILNEFNIKWLNKDNTHIIVNEGILTFLLNENEEVPVINPTTYVISDETGLLQPPIRQGAYLVLSTVFNPYLKVGSKVDLESKILKKYNTSSISLTSGGATNGLYKVQGIQHNVRFSDTVNGPAVTEVKLYVGARRFENRG